MTGRRNAAPDVAGGTPRWLRGVRSAPGLAAAVVIYLVMVGSSGAWAIAQGAVFGAFALALSAGFGEGAAGPRWSSARRLRLLRELPDLLVRQVLLGSWRVARVAAGLAPIPRGGRVTVPLRAPPDSTTLALALLETLSPGTYLVDVDEERCELVFHVFDLDEREDLQRRQARLLDGDAGAHPGGADA